MWESLQAWGLLLSSIGLSGLAAISLSPGSGEYPTSLPYSIYPAPGSYSLKGEVTGYCSSTCVVLTFKGGRLRVEDPKKIVKVGLGEGRVSVDGYNPPVIVSWRGR